MRTFLATIALILGITSVSAKPTLFKNVQMDELNRFVATDVFGSSDPSKVHFDCNYRNTEIPNAKVMQSCDSTVGGITASTTVAGRQLLSIVLTFEPKVSKATTLKAVRAVLVMYQRTDTDPETNAVEDGTALAKDSLAHYWEDGFTDSFDGTARLKLDRINGKTVFRLREGD